MVCLLSNKYRNSKWVINILELRRKISFYVFVLMFTFYCMAFLPLDFIGLKFIFFILSSALEAYFVSLFIGKGENYKNMGEAILLTVLLMIIAVFYFAFLFNNLASFENQIGQVRWLEYIIVITVITPSFIHLWRLIHACTSTGAMLLICLANILIIQGLLYAGLGIATYPETMTSGKLTGNSIDWIFLLLSIGVRSVSQFTSLGMELNPTTHLTMAFVIASIVNALSTGFAISYIASWVTVLRDNKEVDDGGGVVSLAIKLKGQHENNEIFIPRSQRKRK